MEGTVGQAHNPFDSTLISGSGSALLTDDGTTTYFSNLLPFESHPAGDVRCTHLCIARFHLTAGISQITLAEAFGVSRSTVKRAVRRYRDEGATKAATGMVRRGSDELGGFEHASSVGGAASPDVPRLLSFGHERAAVS